jgi:hypothetical protein
MLRRTVSVSTHNGNDGNRYRISGRDRDGTTLTFDAALGDEGTTRWALVVTPLATPCFVQPPKKGSEDAPTWDMSRR